jgi:hypothetical protein
MYILGRKVYLQGRNRPIKFVYWYLERRSSSHLSNWEKSTNQIYILGSNGWVIDTQEEARKILPWVMCNIQNTDHFHATCSCMYNLNCEQK